MLRRSCWRLRGFFLEELDVEEETIKELIYHSFELVYGKLTKKQKALLMKEED